MFVAVEQLIDENDLEHLAVSRKLCPPTRYCRKSEVHVAKSAEDASTRLSPQVETLYFSSVSCFAFTPSIRAPRSNALKIETSSTLRAFDPVDTLGGGKLYRYRAMTSACFTKLLVHAYSLKLLIRRSSQERARSQR